MKPTYRRRSFRQRAQKPSPSRGHGLEKLFSCHYYDLCRPTPAYIRNLIWFTALLPLLLYRIGACSILVPLDFPQEYWLDEEQPFWVQWDVYWQAAELESLFEHAIELSSLGPTPENQAKMIQISTQLVNWAERYDAETQFYTLSDDVHKCDLTFERLGYTYLLRSVHGVGGVCEYVSVNY